MLHRRDLRAPRRSEFPRRRAPRHRPAARQSGPCAGDGRRRLHGSAHPGADRRAGDLHLAARRSRPAAAPRRAPQRPAVAAGGRAAPEAGRADDAAPPGLCRGRHRRRQRRRSAGRDPGAGRRGAGELPGERARAPARGGVSRHERRRSIAGRARPAQLRHPDRTGADRRGRTAYRPAAGASGASSSSPTSASAGIICRCCRRAWRARASPPRPIILPPGEQTKDFAHLAELSEPSAVRSGSSARAC